MVVLTTILAVAGTVPHENKPGQVAMSNPWPIHDLAASAPLPGYAFAQTLPDSTPPTFVSSRLSSDTGALTITFSEAIDVTPAANVVPAKIHIRESGSYTGGITLTAGELAPTTNASTISFTLTVPRLATVTGLTTPELTIDPGAVRDTSGNLIVGTFDVSTAAFVHLFDVSGQEQFPTDMAFSNDGTKMFVVGDDGDDISEYTLSTPFDVSTATFANVVFSVSGQDGTPTGMAFSNDGTKMFVVGWDDEDINEYTLFTPFDVSTAAFVDSFSVSMQEGAPTGMAFSNDGTKMFVVGWDDEDINEYTLSTPFDVSTAAFVDSFSVSMQEGAPTGMAFSNNGTKMFVVGDDGDDISEYTLSTPFDVSTATFANAIFSVSMQETVPTGMAFSNDGTKMFVIGAVGDDINEYTLSSVYPIIVKFQPNRPPVADAGPDENVNEGSIVNLNGTASDPDTRDTLTYAWTHNSTLSISFGNSSAVDTSFTAPNVSEETDIEFTLTVSDGTASASDKTIVTVTGSDVEVTPPTFVSSRLDLATGVFTINFSWVIDVTPATNVVTTKIHIRESGNYTGGITLTAGELDTTADGATISFVLTDQHLDASAGLAVPELTIEPGAIRNAYGTLIAGTFDASTAVFVDATSIRNRSIFPQGMAFSNDGSRMFVIGSNSDNINEYTLSPPFDASTATFVNATSIRDKERFPQGMAFSNDGSRMFVIGSNSDNINEYTLSPPFDASTATFVNATSISLYESVPTDMAFSNDGYKMFVIGHRGADINEYTLSTPFDASTLRFVNATSIEDQERFPQGMAFSNDGYKMFVIGKIEASVVEYTLSAPFDASTLRFVDATSISLYESVPTDIAFSNDGARMFVLGSDVADINEYALSSIYPIIVEFPPNRPPVADAGDDENVNEGSIVNLNGTASDPDTGDQLTQK